MSSGWHQSEEAKNKIRQSKLGVKLSNGHKAKVIENLKKTMEQGFKTNWHNHEKCSQ